MSNRDLIKVCYQKSLELLKSNSCEYGFLASAPQKKAVQRNYLSVFSRDASICSLGALASGDKDLIKSSKRSIVSLAQKQAANGQIPNYVKPGSKRADFWRLGCIDATLWWLITIKLYDKYSGDTKLLERFVKKIEKALFWLECQAHVEDRLLMQNEGSDWADIMPRSGKVLYSNSLWCLVHKLYKIKSRKSVENNFNNLFYPYSVKDTMTVAKCDRTTVEEIRKTSKEANHYLSYVGYLYWGRAVDVYANSLAVLFGVATKEMAEKIIDKLLLQKRRKGLAMPVLFNPISQRSREWRKYMESHNQNFPSQYHNGGVWPFAACFFVMALARVGKKEDAWRELEKIAVANSENNWQFNEWFHAKTGKPSGMYKQSWNAGMFIATYHYLRGEFEF